MPFPKQGDIELPLLKALLNHGGSARPKEIYAEVADFFPRLTLEEQEERLESWPSIRRWWNLVQWTRQRLIESGDIDGSTRGVWKLTAAGRVRAAANATDSDKADASHPTAASELTLRDLANRNRDETKRRLLDELKRLSDTGFERFCTDLLRQLGYRSMTVTRRSKDGGIDGHGDFRQGVVSIRSAFQAKRWSETRVGRPEIDRFRGAIQGDYDHGVFLTTSRFTKDAEDASVRKGAISILLLDGEAIAELMIERTIGVVREPVYLLEIAPEFFDFDGDAN